MIVYDIKWETLKELSLTQLERVPYKCFTAMCCEWKPGPGPKPMIIIEKNNVFFVSDSKLEDRRLCTEL